MERAAAALRARPAVLSTDYRDVLDSGLDAVCIASPDSFHVPQLLDSLSADLHVLCEKPLTLDPGDYEAVLASRDEVGKHVALTYPRRYDGGVRAMRREILSGRWGAVKTVTIYNAEDWVTPNRGTWRHDPEITPGGFFFDASGHQLDCVFWCTGLAGAWVDARMENRGAQVPITITGIAELSNGAPVTFAFVGDAHTWREQINIHCEGADFVIEQARAFWTRDNCQQPMPQDGTDETADEAFIKLIRGDSPNWSPLEDVRPVLEFTRAALESSRTGTRMSVPFE